jgi:hypothetical protein
LANFPGLASQPVGYFVLCLVHPELAYRHQIYKKGG